MCFSSHVPVPPLTEGNTSSQAYHDHANLLGICEVPDVAVHGPNANTHRNEARIRGDSCLERF